MNKILIVDDNKEFLEEITEAVKTAGYRVRPETEGKNALEYARKKHPDLLLLDLKLPDISGFEVAHNMSCTAITADIPIIAMTGHYSEEERKYAINICGIKKCLTKPLDIEELFKEIKNWL